MSEIIKVKMADLNICKSPDGITTLGLGSCVGIALRDPITKVGGLAHIMLPDSTQIRNSSNIYKFADTGIVELIRLIVQAGASANRLEAKIAGGAMMFNLSSSSDIMRVGERNVEATKRLLKQMKIPLLSEDTGKSHGRTVIYYPETGNYVIKAVGQPEKII